MTQGQAHGGYLCRLDGLETAAIPTLARQALKADGQNPDTAGLLVSVHKKVVRFAYDAPHTYGRRGAQWYGRNHALAALLSESSGSTVHVYVFDPEELEQVITYGAGQRVGGETLRYDEAEVDVEELSDQAFEALRERWPMAHLGRLLGLSRLEVLRLPLAKSVLIRLDAEGLPSLEQLWQQAARPVRG
jgi:hypothetical protein